MPEPPEQPTKGQLLVKLQGATRDDREFIINGLKNFVDHDLILVSDTTELIESTAFAVDLLMVFFYAVTLIAIFLCFFVLWLSFANNVRENSWEFGVLRAVGLTKGEVISIYIFEALAIILASVLLSTLIGVAVAWTLTLQYSLFNQMPIHLYFPYTLFVLLLVASVAVGILGSWLPARALAKKEISQTIRGQ